MLRCTSPPMCYKQSHDSKKIPCFDFKQATQQTNHNKEQKQPTNGTQFDEKQNNVT